MTTQATQQHVVPAPGGRVLAVEEAGDPGGLAVLVHNGTPNSRHLYGPHVADATARGLRLISYDRPGYGGSSPQPGRTVADCAADVRAICESLGITRLVSWGISGGGPHLLATAALLPGLVVAAASLASPAPFIAEGLDWFAGMGQENVEEFGLAARGADALTPFLDKEAEALRGISGEQIAAALGGLISGADAAVLTGEFAADLASGLSGAVRNGIAGWLDDDLAFTADWGFGLDALSGRAAIWQGDQDNMVPFAHGRWLAAHIPGARAHLEPGAGHVTMTVTAIDRILDDLLDLAGRR